MRPTPAASRRIAREADRLDAIGAALDAIRARCDVSARVAADPVGLVHAVRGAADRELAAIVASSLAFGNVKALRAKIADAFARCAPSLARAADDPRALAERLRGWKHRVYRAEDLAGLLVGARRVQVADGTLGAALSAEIRRSGDLRAALGAWTARIRREGGLDRDDGARRGARHILADPEAGSAAKRLMLLLRWMARPADGVDLGLWDVPIDRLLVPVDVHVHKLARNLGFTARASVTWRTAEEITAALRRYDPRDPVKYDFALCHLGMAQRCPSRRDEDRCEGCGIRSVCRHWADPPRRRAPSSGA